jgi:hypothetical protein
MAHDQEERRAELREKLMRYRILEQETIDPVARGFSTTSFWNSKAI